MTITHVTQGAPTMTTDATDFSWGTLPEWGLGTLIVPGGGVTPGFHVVFFIDPASLLPTALFTFQATDDHFMYFHFAAEGGFSWASESAAYLGGPYATAMADGTLQDISALINSGPLRVNMQVSAVHGVSVPEAGATAPFLGFSLLLVLLFGVQRSSVTERSGLKGLREKPEVKKHSTNNSQPLRLS